MTKQELKELLKEHGYTMITKSFYSGIHGVLANCYDGYGECWKIYVAHHKQFATLQALSDVCIHEENSIVDWFE